MVGYDDTDDGYDYNDHHYDYNYHDDDGYDDDDQKKAAALTIKLSPFPGELMLEIVSSIMMVMKYKI